MKYCKVEQLENKNQFIIKAEKHIYFQSYDSLIAVYDREKSVLILGRDWNYSKTTMKHLYIFIDCYCNTRILNNLRYAKNKKEYLNYCIKCKDIKDVKYNKNMF